MGTTTVRVPINGSDPYSKSWMYDVSAQIDAGNDVVFVDDIDGITKVEVSRIQLDTAGSVSVFGKLYGSAAAVSISLAAGGLHVVGGIHGIRAAGTDTGIGIHIKV